MPLYSYKGYEIDLRETGQNCVALFKHDESGPPVMVTATVLEGMEVLRERVHALVDLEINASLTGLRKTWLTSNKV